MQDELRKELERTKQEKAAFETFSSHIEEIETEVHQSQPSQAVDASSSATSTFCLSPGIGRRQSDASGKIREKYEQTIMSLPFFDQEYGESYEESIRKEFGPDIATNLLNNTDFTQISKGMLLGKINESQQKRREFIHSCKIERRNVNNTESNLRSIIDQLQTYHNISLEGEDFDTLHSYRTNIATLGEECERMAADRQANIQKYRSKYELTPNECDLPEYIYKDLEYNYPILYLITETSHRIESTLEEVDNALIWK